MTRAINMLHNVFPLKTKTQRNYLMYSNTLHLIYVYITFHFHFQKVTYVDESHHVDNQRTSHLETSKHLAWAPSQIVHTTLQYLNGV